MMEKYEMRRQIGPSICDASGKLSHAEAFGLFMDTCGIPREVLLAEKSDLYEQLAQVNQQIWQERWKLKQCKEISETAVIMQRDIDRVEQQPQRIAVTRQR